MTIEKKLNDIFMVMHDTFYFYLTSFISNRNLL